MTPTLETRFVVLVPEGLPTVWLLDGQPVDAERWIAAYLRDKQARVVHPVARMVRRGSPRGSPRHD